MNDIPGKVPVVEDYIIASFRIEDKVTMEEEVTKLLACGFNLYGNAFASRGYLFQPMVMYGA